MFLSCWQSPITVSLCSIYMHGVKCDLKESTGTIGLFQKLTEHPKGNMGFPQFPPSPILQWEIPKHSLFTCHIGNKGK